MFSTTAMADCFIFTESSTMPKLLAFEAPEWIGDILFYFNSKVSDIDVCQSCSSLKCEDESVSFAAISIVIVRFDCNVEAVCYTL